jgi:alkylated DNA repair dioxygenase AlkB
LNQERLFEADDFSYEPAVIVSRDGRVTYDPYFLRPVDADRLFRRIREEAPWRQDSIKMYGKSILVPRLTAWYGDENASYTYSGIRNEPLPWSTSLVELRDLLEKSLNVRFNSVLLNLYRTGNDSLSWHADDEAELGVEPTIASISLGVTRTFSLAHKVDGESLSLPLEHGSLLLMTGATQAFWKHQVPKERNVSGERINATFRVINARPVYSRGVGASGAARSQRQNARRN